IQNTRRGSHLWERIVSSIFSLTSIMDDFISGKGCQIERHLTSLPGDEEKNPWKLSRKNEGVVENICP
ncbi:hypothetical protein, partial [Heyndrickxia coagulans]|uniref:hypothetical protein n=5 Tax=Heyndrickxia TaxID=2837504 RepID=UPI002E236A59|nr:hypothetical protein [Heyndrickxia coagulans]